MRPNVLKLIVAAAAVGAALIGCSGGAPTPSPAPRFDQPTLLVFITIDQFQPAYLDRFGGELRGGLARLMKGGAWFTDGHQDYAITETAPGHASTMSGRFPRSHGITRNLAGVGDRSSPLIGSNDGGASPTRFRGSTLTDWLTAADPRTRALSVSAKDRGAILPIGRSKQQVYWFATHNGLFTTSRWYADTLPTWLRDFNAREHASRYAGTEWNLLEDSSRYPEKDDVPFEVDGKDHAFPHRFPADTFLTDSLFRFTPFMDEVTARLALEGVRRLDLGRGPTTDLLAISFSATDYIGHFYGPESREQHDQILRLDRTLGALLDTLFMLRDSTRIIVAMTADHGGGRIPELHGKLRVNMDSLVAALRKELVAKGASPGAIDFESGGFFVDSARLGSTMSREDVISRFVTEARKMPGIQRIDRFDQFATMDTSRDYVARRWLHMFPAETAPAVAVTLESGNLYRFPTQPYPKPIVASHGSPHPADSHVPIIFLGPPFRPGRHGGFVRTVDIAPTLARVLGVPPTEPLDGRPLLEALRDRSGAPR